MAVQGDVSIEADVLRLFKEVDRMGVLTVLVNNAGIVDRSSRVENLSAERIQRMLAINVTGSFLCAREAVKRMSTKHGGKGGADRQRFLDGGKARAARATTWTTPRRRRDRQLHRRPGEGSRRGRHPRERGAAWRDRTEIHATSGDPSASSASPPATPLQRGGDADEVARAILWLASAEPRTSPARCSTSPAGASLARTAYALLGPTRAASRRSRSRSPSGSAWKS
jgi:NAD(P)-dependent dehydrogenase (short-subunit alcohol dehydrogenase family)